MNGTQSLQAKLMAMDSADRLLARSIVGTEDAAEIARMIEQFCRIHLHQGFVNCEFWEVSVSFVVGLRLEDDRRVVIKIRSRDNISLETLQAVCIVQQGLADRQLPCPVVLLPPVVLNAGFATVEELLDTGEQGNAHQPQIRQAMAIGLAEQIAAAQAFVDLPGLPQSRFRADQLWEKPHNALFDFQKTCRGAEWIDAIASRAQTIFLPEPRPLLLGHMDWSAKNMRFANGKISAIYDWDSLRLDTEPVILGNAAESFLVNWYIDVAPLVPSPVEVRQFVQAYEAAKGTSFSQAEREIIAAAFLYSMAYTARCEHAIDPTGEKIKGSFREALHQHEAYWQALQA